MRLNFLNNHKIFIKMNLNFQKGVSFQIEGEMGKFNTLPIEVLVKIAENLQSLIKNIAIADVSDESALDLNAFKIELSAFRAGSAVPEFVFTPRVQEVITGDVQKQRELVNTRFENLISISTLGNFDKINEEYPNPAIRNNIVESFYDFSNSFGKSPVKIVDFSAENKIVPLYPLNKISSEIKHKLVSPTGESDNTSPIEEIIFARQKRITKGDRSRVLTLDQYSPNESISICYAPEIIESENKVYHLNFPIRCNLEHEDDQYFISCEMLDIFSSGATQNEAQENFNIEFDFVYSRYIELDDEELSNKNLNIKKLLIYFVRSIVEK